MKYDSLEDWGDVLQTYSPAAKSDYVDDVLRDYDLRTCDGVRDLSSAVIDALQKNLVPTTDDAITLWQRSQCLKKFRYGCTATPEEMQLAWIERNALCAAPYQGPGWVLDAVKQLLAPLGPTFEAMEGQGRFGNGAVYEGYNTFARWNYLESFSYNVCDPCDISDWRAGPPLSCRLSCVPKDMFKLRSITVEPAENTFIQQLIRTLLIRSAGRHLPYSSAVPQQAWGGGPELQRRRALQGSLDGTVATIDLSNASDCVRWDVISYVFPTNIVARLEKARTPYVEVGGTRYRVHMYAGMGNATTFIVETLFFWALCTVLSRWLRDFTPVSVFGDDIIVSTKVANHPLFQEYLQSAGLILNMAKSGLSEVPGFREACGLCAYRGVELPLLRINGYRTEQPEELVSLCGLVNAALAPDSLYAPSCRTWATMVGRDLVETYHLPILPCNLIEQGAYLVDASMGIGDWSYSARWEPQTQHPVVKVGVLRQRRGKTLSFGDLTPGEAMGILSGQLHTAFADAKVGYSSRKTRFQLHPLKGQAEFRLEHRWVPCWSTDSSLVSLVDE